MKKLEEEKATPEVMEKTPEIIELLKKADQKSSTLSRVEPAGLGLLVNCIWIYSIAWS